jgi:hypothetical protein
VDDHLSRRCPGAGEPGTASRLLVLLLGLLGFVLLPGPGASPAGVLGGGSVQRSVSLTVGSAPSGARTAHNVRAATRGDSAPQSATMSAHHAQTSGAHGPGPGILPAVAGSSAGQRGSGWSGTDQVVLPGAATGTPRGRAPPSSMGS